MVRVARPSAATVSSAADATVPGSDASADDACSNGYQRSMMPRVSAAMRPMIRSIRTDCTTWSMKNTNTPIAASAKTNATVIATPGTNAACPAASSADRTARRVTSAYT